MYTSVTDGMDHRANYCTNIHKHQISPIVNDLYPAGEGAGDKNRR